MNEKTEHEQDEAKPEAQSAEQINAVSGCNEPVIITKSIIYFDERIVLLCDAICSKAWGINSRPKNQLSDDDDDYEFLADSELADAPIDPGTYEGGCGKPRINSERLNKWCARECERSILAKENEEYTLHDFTKRNKNIPD